MTNYRTIVIMKTDIVDSTIRLADQTESEMGLQRKQHRQFISEHAIKYHGSIFQEEGDAYWIEISSVTNAVLAALEMHQDLRSSQAGKGEKQRLAIRAVITVGDTLRQENDTMGMTMSLTVRLEKITPPDEIFLSHAAWLVMNKAEVQTSFVGEFELKGFNEPEKVYRVNQKTGIRELSDQCIVLADARGFSRFFNTHGREDVERFLLEYDALMNEVCSKHGGVVRQVMGDMYFLTFENADQTIAALRMLCQNWNSIRERFNVGLSIGVHKGSLQVFRSYVFGNDINITEYLSDLGRYFKTDRDQIFAVISGKVRDEANVNFDDIKFQDLDAETLTQEEYQAVVREHRAFRFMVEGS